MIPDAQPHDYLEKIFQIPFWLRRIEEDGIKNMVRGLVGPLKAIAPSATHDMQNGNSEHGGQIKYLSALPTKGQTENLDPEVQEIQKQELDFMDKLAPLLSRTPRSLKRFVNLYRLVRAGLSEIERTNFVTKNGQLADYEAVQIILALLCGPPKMARAYRTCIDNSPASISDIITTTLQDSDGLVTPDWVSTRNFDPDDLERFKKWSHRVARFSF